MADLTIPLPKEYSGLVDDFALDRFRVELLQNGLLGVKDELWRIAELPEFPEKGVREPLRECIRKLQWYETEIAKLAEEER